MASVEASEVNKQFGSLKALDNISMVFPDGQFFGLLGPSGSGKTTLLRAIAGFISTDTGTIRIGDQSVDSVPVEKREIGMVFQNYALFPNMTVADNIGFGLRVRRKSAPEINRMVGDVLGLVHLGELGDRRPHELSGGQRQRVALARAIVTQPRVLLLDEPLSALDKSLRMEMQIELKRIQREVGITTIFVTHDQEEALTLSDQIGILKSGRVVQSGSPLKIYNAPSSRFAARFLGEANIFEGEPEIGGLRILDGSILRWTRVGEMDSSPKAAAIRPEYIEISSDQPGSNQKTNQLKATLNQKVFAGPTVTCILDWHGTTVKALASGDKIEKLPDPGEVWISWPHRKTIPLTE